jgi:hypothetical protein
MTPNFVFNSIDELANVSSLVRCNTFGTVPILERLQGRRMLEKIGNSNLIDAASP